MVVPYGHSTDRYDIESILVWFYIELFQTYIRIIVRANAKKRRTYEQFIETVHLLKVSQYQTIYRLNLVRNRVFRITS